MEGPLLTKSEHNLDDVTIHGDSYSTDEHIVDVTTNGDSSTDDEHSVDVTTNGDSSSDDEQTPHEGVQWISMGVQWITMGVQCITMAIELVCCLGKLAVRPFQIVAAIFFLTLTKNEQHPELEVPLFIWIIGYTCASVAELLVPCLRLCDLVPGPDAEMENSLEKDIEYFFVVWIVMFLWFVLTRSSCLEDTTQHLWLWMALLAFSCIRYVLPNLDWALRIFVYPMLDSVMKLWEFIEKIGKALMGLFSCICGLFGCSDDDVSFQFLAELL